MYYVSSYKEDEVSLKGTKLEEDSKNLSFEELEEFAKENVVMGFNPITKEVSVKTLTDIMNNLNSKLRLTGITTGQGVKIDNAVFKWANNGIYCTHEMEGKAILVAEPLTEYNGVLEYKNGEPYRYVMSIKLTLPDHVVRNVDVIRLNWRNILTPAVHTSHQILNIIIDFPFASKVIGFNPLIKYHTIIVEDIEFTDNFSMNNAKVSGDAFNMIAEFKGGEIVQTKDGYRLLSESIGKWLHKWED